MRRESWLVGVLLFAAGCSGREEPGVDAGTDAGSDAGRQDAGADGGIGADAALRDAGTDAPLPTGDAGPPCPDPDGPGAFEAVGGRIDRSAAPSVLVSTLALDATDTPSLAWMEGVSSAHYDVFASAWGGVSWDALGVVLDVFPGATSSESPSLVIDDAGRPVLAWSEANGAGPLIHVQRFEAGGWAPLAAPLGAPLTGNYAPTLVRSPDGTLFVSWVEYSGAGWTIRLRAWDGAAWSTPVPPPLPPAPQVQNVRFGVDDAGAIYLAYVSIPVGSLGTVHVTRWSAGSWAELGPAFPMGTAYPELVLDVSRRPIIAFRNASAIEVRRWNGASWDTLASPTADLPGSVAVVAPRISADDSQRPIIALVMNMVGLYVRRWNGSSWDTLGTPGLHADGQVLGELSLVTGRCGEPYVAWVQLMGGPGESYAHVARYVIAP